MTNTMTNIITVIHNEVVLGKEFSVYGTAEHPMFLAKDVAEWIGLTNVTDMVSRVDEDEVTKFNLGGQIGECNFLTENGVYEVMMQSRKPIAKEFKKEVKRILKLMRITGGAVVSGREMEFIQNMFPSFSPEVQSAMAIDLARRNEELREQLDKTTKELKESNDIIEEMKPIFDYGTTVLKAPKLCTVTDIAKDIGMSAKALNKILKDEGVQYKKGNTWYLTYKYQELVPEYADYHITEHGQTLKWTESGRRWLLECLGEIKPEEKQ